MRFHIPTKIIFESGALSQLKDVVKKELKASRPFLVTDQGISDSGIAEKVLSQIDTVSVFDQIEQNPKHETVDKAGLYAREHEPDLIIGLGGGSPLDAAKAVALLATNPGSIKDYEGKEKYDEPPLPVLAIPTTCGTGSEVTWVSVITDTRRKFKMSIKGPLMFPAAALVDPDLLKTLPRPMVASTGLDALTHAIEAFTVKPATFLSNIFAYRALRLIFGSLSKAVADIKANAAARESIMKGSLLAGIAFGNSDVGAVHCISESVGALFNMSHGVANSIFLPYVMEYNLPACAKKYAEIARLIGVKEKEPKKAAQALIDWIKKLSRSFGIPQLKETGIGVGQFPTIASKSFENNSNSSNPRDLSHEDYLEILTNAFLGA
jgi:alcohol dehydrogenase